MSHQQLYHESLDVQKARQLYTSNGLPFNIVEVQEGVDPPGGAGDPPGGAGGHDGGAGGTGAGAVS